MLTRKKANLTWMVLIGLTLAGAASGRLAQPGLLITLLIATVTAVKGRLVIDQFMEAGDATPVIRRLMRLFGLLVPFLMVLGYLFGPEIARLTALGN